MGILGKLFGKPREVIDVRPDLFNFEPITQAMWEQLTEQKPNKATDDTKGWLWVLSGIIIDVSPDGSPLYPVVGAMPGRGFYMMGMPVSEKTFHMMCRAKTEPKPVG